MGYSRRSPRHFTLCALLILAVSLKFKVTIRLYCYILLRLFHVLYAVYSKGLILVKRTCIRSSSTIFFFLIAYTQLVLWLDHVPFRSTVKHDHVLNRKRILYIYYWFLAKSFLILVRFFGLVQFVLYTELYVSEALTLILHIAWTICYEYPSRVLNFFLFPMSAVILCGIYYFGGG